MTDLIHLLVGTRVRAVYLAADQESMALQCDTAVFHGTCYSECCSHTYIYHISGIPALLSAPVTAVRELTFSPRSLEGKAREYAMRHGGWEQDVEIQYGVQISTAAGVCTIDFRNYSNGYYGGSLDWSLRSDVPLDLEKLPEDL